MRAAVVTEPGRPPTPGQRPDPDPPAGWALVEVTAAPIIPLDLLCASGTSYFGAPATPYVPGVQGVGTVVRAAGVASGPRVWFPTSAGMGPGDGSMAELCAAPDGDLVEVPPGLDDAAAAALGLSAVAAWMVLARAALQPGERVLVLGAGGVVGQVAVQAARLLGAGLVVAAARSDGARARASAAGADEVVGLVPDEDAQPLSRRLGAALGGLADVVVDPLCGVPASAAGLVLGERGRLVNLGSSAGPRAEFDSALLRSRSASILGYTNNALSTQERSDALSAVLEHAAAGRLSVAHEVVPLDDVEDAWTRQAQGRTAGRLVLRP